jgi:hypothetical protein
MMDKLFTTITLKTATNTLIVVDIPLLISVEDFAFRGRAGSLLVAALLWGLPSLAFPAGVFVFHSNQQLDLVKIKYLYLTESSLLFTPFVHCIGLKAISKTI